METLKTYLEALQFACHDKSCAPPPIGTGGSKGGGQSTAGRHAAVRKSFTTADDDSEAVRKAKMVAQARQGWRPNVDRSTPGASRVPEDTGQIMSEISKLARLDQLPGEEHGADQLMSGIYERRGFNKHAQQLDAEDFEQFLRDNPDSHLEGWRGVDAGAVPSFTNEYQRENAARIALSFHEDERHWAGRGILGNGTYVAVNHPDSEQGFQRSVHESSLYSSKTNPVQIHMAVPTDNLATYSHIESVGLVIGRLTRTLSGDRPPAGQENDTPTDVIRRGVEGRMGDRWESITPREAAMGMEIVRQGLNSGMSLSQIEVVTRDAGRLSALIGYDGIITQIPGGGQSEYAVVHNRGAIVLDHTVYATTKKDPDKRFPMAQDMNAPVPHEAWNDESQRSR